MKKTLFIVPLLFTFMLGCQSTRNGHWLTPPKGGSEQILGQGPSDDPFFSVLSGAMDSAPATSSPTFDPFAPVQQLETRPDFALREVDRQRIQRLATTPQEGAPDYLQPLRPWDGPFANRSHSKTLEQDIIRQAGYEQVVAKNYLNEPEYDWEKPEPKKGFDWSKLAPENTFSRTRDWLGLGPDENKANTAMQKGKDILLVNPDLTDKKKNIEAAKHFREAAKRFPDSVLEEDALHLAGECYFFADNYPNAFSAYQKLVIKYQHSKHMDNAIRRIFATAQYWEQESEKSSLSFNVSDSSLPHYDTFGFAKKAYETIFIHDPLGPASDSALMALANAYLKRGKYQGDDNYNQAAYYYQRLREDHPTSKYIAKAHECELYARTRAYMGAEHPDRTLIEARKLAEMTLWQFSNELDSESKANILERKEEILVGEAERLWKTGQFWDLKKRHYGSAKVYYHRLMVEYPQTMYAEMARNRLELIEAMPDRPSIFSLPVNPFKGE